MAFNWNGTKTAAEAGFKVKPSGNSAAKAFAAQAAQQRKYAKMPESARPKRGLWFKQSGDQVLLIPRRGSRPVALFGKPEHVFAFSDLDAALADIETRAPQGAFDAELEAAVSGGKGKPASTRKPKSK